MKIAPYTTLRLERDLWVKCGMDIKMKKDRKKTGPHGIETLDIRPKSTHETKNKKRPKWRRLARIAIATAGLGSIRVKSPQKSGIGAGAQRNAQTIAQKEKPETHHIGKNPVKPGINEAGAIQKRTSSNNESIKKSMAVGDLIAKELLEKMAQRRRNAHAILMTAQSFLKNTAKKISEKSAALFKKGARPVGGILAVGVVFSMGALWNSDGESVESGILPLPQSRLPAGVAEQRSLAVTTKCTVIRRGGVWIANVESDLPSGPIAIVLEGDGDQIRNLRERSMNAPWPGMSEKKKPEDNNGDEPLWRFVMADQGHGFTISGHNGKISRIKESFIDNFGPVGRLMEARGEADCTVVLMAKSMVLADIEKIKDPDFPD